MKPEEIGSAIKAFMQDLCPACSLAKQLIIDAFCQACLTRLPVQLRSAVEDRAQFIEGYHPALSYLSAPPEPAGKKTGRKSNRIVKAADPSTGTGRSKRSASADVA